MSNNEDKFEALKLQVIQYLKNSPKLPHEIASHCGYKSVTSFKRDYLSRIESLGLIEKVQGSNRYQLTGQKATQKSIIVNITSNDDFYNTDVIQQWRKRNNAKNRESIISTFKGICLGTLQKNGSKTPFNFKINPDGWTHPNDTERVIHELKLYFAVDELDYRYRMSLRYALQYGMKIILTQAESEALGISGKTMKPELSTLHISDEQVNNILSDKNIDTYHKNLFFFSYSTFFRPSTRYIVKNENIQFYDRVVPYIQLENGHKITNKKDVEALSSNYSVKEFKHRAATVDNTMEFKTIQVYPKYVWHESFVDEFEKYVNSRIHQGYKYLFWNDNKTIFDEKNYNTIVASPRGKDNSYFVEMFFKNGFKKGDFGKQNDANYAIRHMGVQKWLVITDYDYGKIMILGWEDINTLIKWYGKRHLQQVAKTFGEVLF